MALIINLGYSQYCLSFGDAGSKLLKSLIYLFKPKNSSMDTSRCILLKRDEIFSSPPPSSWTKMKKYFCPFSPTILSYLLPAALKSIRLISGIPLLTANSLLGRPRRDTGLVSLYIYSSLTYNRGLLNNESLG